MNGLSPGKYVPSIQICTEPFNSRYTVQEDIGRGKFAVVKKCLNNETGEVVAAKIIRKRRKGKSCRDEILREVVMLEFAMTHPRLVSLREVFETSHELILVTEYCSGGELFHECVINESFQEDDVRKLLVQILEGLAYLHDNNIVHLDLKPQNILLTKPFPHGDVKICDLGFACLTNTGEDIRDIIGTPDYVAPEVLDYEPLNIQTDMWSLGVLTYVMLTTCSPFVGDDQNETFSNITQIKLDFPDELFGHINILAQDFISKLLVKKPRDRLTAKECLDHPWLADLTKQLAISVPTPDHSFELAQEMVTPSNWRLSVDRQSSLASLESSRNSSVSVEEVLHTSAISEDKDSISQTLSHIDIDHRGSADKSISPTSSLVYQSCVNSTDSSSSSVFVTCVSSLESISSKKSVDKVSTLTSTSLSLVTNDSLSEDSSTLTTLSDEGEKHKLLSTFAIEFVQDTLSISEANCGNKNTTNPSPLTPPTPPNTNKCLNQCNSDSTPSSLPSDCENGMFSLHAASSEVNSILSSESIKQQNTFKRMSMEIPPKKAKCIVDTPSSSPLPQYQHQVPESNGQPLNNNNNIEDFRNAV